MPSTSALRRAMPHTITLWPHSGSFDQYGDPAFGDPMEIKGRWEERSEQFALVTGDQSQSRAIVWTTQLIRVDDYLYLGISVVANPETAGADKVRRVEFVPDLRDTVRLYKVFL